MDARTPAARPRLRRTQAERRDQSERALVEATLAVVAEQGVAAATFDAIGQRAGLSRGLASQRFGSKAALVEAVIAHLHRLREEVLEADHVADMAPFAAIAHYVEAHLPDRGAEGSRAYFMLMAQAVADAGPLRGLFAASHERVRTWLRATLERGQADGSLRAGLDADAAALMIGSQIMGVSIQALVDPAADIAAIRASVIETLRRALLAPA